MTIKQSEAVKAYQSIQGLNRQKFNSGKIAKKIYELTMKLKSAFDFQLQEEEKIYSKYPDFDPMIGGFHIGKDDENREKKISDVKEINKQLKEIADLDFDLDFEPFDLDLEIYNVQISGEDIGNLQKLVNFI